MKKTPTLFFQTVVVAIGVAALAFLIWEPLVEGRNAHATLYEVYFKDPFLALVYVGSLPFFTALFQTFKVLGYAGQGRVFSKEALKSLRTIKVCAFAVIAFVAVEEILIVLGDSDDRAGGVFMGALVTFGSLVAVVVTASFERFIRNRGISS
ncbi:MAG: DUF2975 domain-containing protein [candidate division FCPU426 bacterium]